MDAEQFYESGIVKAKSGDYSGALLDLNQAIEIAPSSEIYDFRAYVLECLGDRQGSLKDLSRAIELNPSFAVAYSNRGILKFNIGDFHGAINDYDRAIALKPDFSNAYTNRGNANRVLANIHEAIDDHTHAIRYNPEHADAHLNRAVSQADLGNWQSAITDLKKAINLFKRQNRYDAQQQAEKILYEITGVKARKIILAGIFVFIACITTFLLSSTPQFRGFVFYLLGVAFYFFLVILIAIRITPLANSLLCFAVSIDNKLLAKILLFTKVNPNTKGKSGIVPLHLVKSRSMAQNLIVKGARVDATVLNHLTPLHFAAIQGKQYIAALLIEQGANIDETDQLARTPLHYAVSCGHYDTSQFFIAHGADINSRDGNGATPLHFAAFYDQFFLAQLLISRGADVSAINNEGKTPLHEVKSKGVASLLIDSGANVNASKIQAASDQYFYHTDGSLYRSYSYSFGNQVNTDPSQGATPLHYAVESNNYELVELFSHRGANLNASDIKGKTALHKVESVEIAKFLIENGADINARDDSDCTPLHCASGVALDPSMMDNLIAAMTPSSLIPKSQNNQKDRKSIVSLLIEIGADINIVDNEGQSPVFYAVIGRDLDVVKLLIRHGSDISITDNSGKNVLLVAEESKQPKIVSFLRQYIK